MSCVNELGNQFTALFPLQLARVRVWQRRHESDPTVQALVLAQARVNSVVYLVPGDADAGLQHDGGGGPAVCGHYRALMHAWYRAYHLLYFFRRYLAPLELEAELLPGDEGDLLALVHVEHVARPVPAVRGERLRRRCLVLVVTLNNTNAINVQFSALIEPQLFAILVDDLVI
ncbi:unnamed protein product [Chrysodeixis includens]|uniref:Uncharacterized protein n=1 Tax=Chrysodeixis includens TaxID=689277 RepID=A0A9N8KXT8_CHRIL|nr:unnamed protein product [Chrysodeixis includens]